MRSDWDPEHVARKGRNTQGEERLAQFTHEELRAIEESLDFFITYDSRYLTPAHRTAQEKVGVRLKQMRTRRGGRTG